MTALARHQIARQDAAHAAIVAHCGLLHAMRAHGPNHVECWDAWRRAAAADARLDATTAAVRLEQRRSTP